MSIKDIADRLGVHPNTVRFHLDGLLESGRVERVKGSVRTPGRPPQLFRPVRGMDPEGPRSYRVLAQILVEAFADDPDAGRRASDAGREWGRRRAAALSEARGGDPRTPDESVDRLADLLDEIGFAPEVSDSEPQIGLRHCPFLEIAVDSPHIVCAIHLGLMQGAVEQWRAPVNVDRLTPLAEPDRCVAHLATADQR